MDAVEFLNEGTRMCNSYEACVGCPMEQTDDCCMVKMNLKHMISIVEQWAKEHPVKTRQSEFLKMFPNASVGYNDTLVICPSQADTKAVAECVRSERNCDKCKRDFWLKEIE
nr:MAG TPA: hypothetical protein [Caudoviricetes sp.]